MCGIAGVWGTCDEETVRAIMMKPKEQGWDSVNHIIWVWHTIGTQTPKAGDPELDRQPSILLPSINFR